MSHLLPSYLRTLRKQWGLSQPELAELLGISSSALCKVETLARKPSAKLLLSAEIIFGLPTQDIFPAAHGAIAQDILKRAQALSNRLETKTDAANLQKLRLLTEIIERSNAPE